MDHRISQPAYEQLSRRRPAWFATSSDNLPDPALDATDLPLGISTADYGDRGPTAPLDGFPEEPKAINQGRPVETVVLLSQPLRNGTRSTSVNLVGTPGPQKTAP